MDLILGATGDILAEINGVDVSVKRGRRHLKPHGQPEETPCLLLYFKWLDVGLTKIV